jgi:hypothetical protein
MTRRHAGVPLSETSLLPPLPLLSSPAAAAAAAASPAACVCIVGRHSCGDRRAPGTWLRLFLLLLMLTRVARRIIVGGVGGGALARRSARMDGARIFVGPRPKSKVTAGY